MLALPNERAQEIPDHDACVGESAAVVRPHRIPQSPHAGRNSLQLGHRRAPSFRGTLGAGGSGGLATHACLRHAVMGAMVFSCTILPPFMEKTRSQIRSKSPVLWLTITALWPSRLSAKRRSQHWTWNAASPTAKISSSSSTSPGTAVETANPSLWRIPVE